MITTQKTIQLNETFSSHNEFKTVLQLYSQETNQIFTATDAKRLKPRDSSQEEANFVQRFVYKHQLFECINGKKKENGYVKRGLRLNTSSIKLNCPCQFRLNFNESKQLFEITKFFTEHNHPIDVDAFEKYSNKGKRKSMKCVEF